MPATKPLTRSSPVRTRSAHCYASGTTHPESRRFTAQNPATTLATIRRAVCPSCGQLEPVTSVVDDVWKIAQHQYRTPVDPDAVRVVLGRTILDDYFARGPMLAPRNHPVWVAIAEARTHQNAIDVPDAVLHVYLPESAARDLLWDARNRVGELRRRDSAEWVPDARTSAYGRLVRQLDKALP